MFIASISLIGWVSAASFVSFKTRYTRYLASTYFKARRMRTQASFPPGESHAISYAETCKDYNSNNCCMSVEPSCQLAVGLYRTACTHAPIHSNRGSHFVTVSRSARQLWAMAACYLQQQQDCQCEISLFDCLLNACTQC